jgi:hypothetical protein
MVLEYWPTVEDLGPSYYRVWLLKAVAWTIVTEYCENEEWYLELERVSNRVATSCDGIRDMVAFFEVFYEGIMYYDFQLHMIVRNVMTLF